MLINTVIRNKRKELEMTQEQIADYLGVSTPAVNKWEKGTTYPDITLLPPLARILKIDLNTLLCFEEGMTTNEILQFSTQIIDHIEKNGFVSGFDLAIDKIKEYPNSAELIESIALLLDGALLMYGAELATKEYYEEQIFSLYERAAKGDDEKARIKALYMLVSKYMQKKDYEKAQQTLDLLPERSELDKKKLQAQILRTQNNLPEAAKLLEQKLLKAINEVQMTIFDLIEVTLTEGNDIKAEKLSNGLREIVNQFELWDYNAYVAPLQIAVKKKNISESISIFQSMLKCMMDPWSLQNTILYNHLHKQENQPSKDNQMKQSDFGTKMLPSILSNMENNPDYEFLRSSQEFVKLIEEYWKKCDKTTEKVRNSINPKE
ncbi:MAG TPA: helix-turn-helix domain-containing protein [Mobilitalea sp.]|nr:helix-turn-helix domain-containing protein [Mobilitalea sp.]